MFKSRVVTEDGFYEINFTSHGIDLTKISKEETNEIPYSHWMYLFASQHIEGIDIHNCKRITPEIKLFQKDDHKCDFKPYIGLYEVYSICDCGERK